MRPIVEAILILLDLYVWIVIASAIFSWLYAFGVVNPRNQIVSTIGDVLYRATEPLYRPIRRFMPDLGGLDLSPIVLLLIIYIVQRSLVLYVLPAVF
ncbi:YggT family protein [Methyloraptor flagellatus]|uniref:YggT family protein n=1 Tax=Methyloraptor flagellatus TaxID=3162530 RepID=A0AAU7X879_9HYPH